jgi:uncharacterized protein (TIGR00251 family)
VLTVTPTALRIAVRVQPRSRRDRVVGGQGGVLKVQVTAAPVDGAANQAVVELLADWLRVPRRSVTVIRGRTGRDKLVEVQSDDPQRLARAIRTRVDNPEAAD